MLKLEHFGQRIWMDFIRRGMFVSGELKQLIEEDGLDGMTSNPSIFEKAITDSHDYDDAIRSLALEGKSVDRIYFGSHTYGRIDVTGAFHTHWETQ